jgi:succinyl-CoA synthetase beta subunit
MLEAAANLEFEKAASLRDQIAKLQGKAVASPQVKKGRRGKGGNRGSSRGPGRNMV